MQREVCVRSQSQLAHWTATAQRLHPSIMKAEGDEKRREERRDNEGSQIHVCSLRSLDSTMMFWYG